MTRLTASIFALLIGAVTPLAHADILDYMDFPKPTADPARAKKSPRQTSAQSGQAVIGTQADAAPGGPMTAKGATNLPVSVSPPSSGLCDGS